MYLCITHRNTPRPVVVMYWLANGNEASACVWEVPGTNNEDFN
jgi:hypothetical protein